VSQDAGLYQNCRLGFGYAHFDGLLAALAGNSEHALPVLMVLWIHAAAKAAVRVNPQVFSFSILAVLSAGWAPCPKHAIR
jgi:hypothetical protein